MAKGVLTLVCGDCRKRTKGRKRDAYTRGCPSCGGPLRVLTYSPSRRRRK